MRILQNLLWSLLAFAGTASAQGTGYAYYPLTPSTAITYQVFEIEGYWHDAVMKLDVLTRRPHVNSPQALSFSKDTCVPFFGDGPLYKIQYPSGALEDGGWWIDGIEYIGEAVNEFGNVHIPFIAKLARNPTQGQEIRGATTVYARCDPAKTVIQNNFTWRYRTIEQLAIWGAFSDVWRTGLREFPSNAVYNYVFMRNVGMVNFWYGKLDPSTNRVVGYEFYAVSY